MKRFYTALIVLLTAAPTFAADPKPKPHGLPAVDLKQPIVWGSTAEGENGFALSFGGMDQSAPDGIAHTRIKENGQWKDIYTDLRKTNPFQPAVDHLRKIRDAQKSLLARIRSAYFNDLTGDALDQFETDLKKTESAIAQDILTVIEELKSNTPRDNDSEFALESISRKIDELGKHRIPLLTPKLVRESFEVQIEIEKVADRLDCEPSPRALSPILYLPGKNQFILFGGDHLDYLTNDIWVFSENPYRWQHIEMRFMPPPRANHSIALDDGKMTITGGYTYSNNTDYVGGQYIDYADGTWTIDLDKRTCKNEGVQGIQSNQRLYRAGPFHPNYFFLDTEKPDAAKFQAFLQNIPANTWTKTNPPRLPRLNRDWGTAILDTDRDLILRWSGGHSAHGGTDVLHYHRATNRWELSAPVEFPLGQLYSNTSYPAGVSFNGRAWITGHTYQNYAYDPISKKMIFTGQHKQFFPYDSEIAEWLPGQNKPKEMAYDSCFYTLTCTTTPQGIYCWTNEGKLFFYDSTKPTPWVPIPLTGQKLAGAVVDNSTVIHDSKRNRLIFFRKQYGDKSKYDGMMETVDLKTHEVAAISPQNAGAAIDVSYLCQIRYDAENDLLLAGCTLPPDAAGQRRTPAYDPTTNQWISLKITGDDPSGKAGRNVSLGLMYDATRKLFWAVDTNSQVYVLRLDPKSADSKVLQ